MPTKNPAWRLLQTATIGIASHSGAEPRQLWRLSSAMVADSDRKSNSCGRDCNLGSSTSATISRIETCANNGAAVSDIARTTKQRVQAVHANLSSFRPKDPKWLKIEPIRTSLH